MNEKTMNRVYSFPKSSPLRLRFATWSLAVVGSLSSGAFVSLPSAAWGFDDPQKEEKKETLPDESAKPEAESFSRAAFSKLLSAGKLDEATAMIDAELAKSPEDSMLASMELQLAMYQTRTAPDAAKKRFETIRNRVLEKSELDNASAIALSQATTYLVQMNSDEDINAQLKTLDAALEKLQAANPLFTATPLRMVLSTKCRALLNADKAEEAKQLLDGMLANAQTQVASGQKSALGTFSSIALLYHSSLGDKYPAESDAAIKQAETLLKASVDAADAKVSDFAAYISLKSSIVSNSLYTDPKSCVPIIEEMEKTLEDAKERFDEAELRALATISRSLDSLKPRLKSALVREELIGKEAPEIDAEHFVGTSSTNMAALRGKVVLLDFWAVWCGPCIATFPHLIEWHEKYADRGLVILGATKFYSYKWNEETDKAERAPEVSPEEELAMLEKFRESYKLHHGFFVSPAASEYSSAFAVSGIPQAVLLDQEGKIQLIRVGSGEANAKAIEAKIEELLTKSPAKPAGQ